MRLQTTADQFLCVRLPPLLLQMRLGERAPRVRGGSVSGGLLKRFIKPDERWLEFMVILGMLVCC